MRRFKIGMALFILVFIIFGCAREIPEKIEWIYSLEEAKKVAEKEHKGLIVDFYREDCKWCKRMDDSTFVAENVRKLSWDYVFVKLDAKVETSLVKEESISGLPTVIIYSSPKRELDRIVDYLPADSFEIYIRNYEKGIWTLEYYEKKVQADSTNVELLFGLADKYRWHGRYQEGLDYFYKIVEIDPLNVKKYSDRALYNIGDIYFRKKDYKGAIGGFQNLLDKYPDSKYSLDAKLIIPYSHAKLGKKTTALVLYRKFLKEHPGEEDQWIQKQIGKLQGKGK